MWLAPWNAARILRNTTVADTTPWRDYDQPINSPYRTSALPSRRNGVLSHHDPDARLKGAGVCSWTQYSLDQTRSWPYRQVDLSATPDAFIHRRGGLKSEAAIHEFSTNAVDAHWSLSALVHRFSPWVSTR